MVDITYNVVDGHVEYVITSDSSIYDGDNNLLPQFQLSTFHLVLNRSEVDITQRISDSFSFIITNVFPITNDGVECIFKSDYDLFPTQATIVYGYIPPILDKWSFTNGEDWELETLTDKYISYREDCDIIMTEDFFNSELQKFTVYEPFDKIQDIVFVPDMIEQSYIDYYFVELELRIPKKY